MTSLFSYCITHDHGAAPNPFWGVCTLVICKPKIRRVAQVGDWVVGTGSADSPIGDIRGSIVYAMKVTGRMSVQQYETHAQKHLPNKIPDWYSGDPRRMVGDAIYDFDHDPPKVRKSIHDESNRARNLGGQYALLSEHFYYFGDRPRQLPERLLGLVKRGPAHRSCVNAEYLGPFLEWLESLGLKPNRLYSRPQGELFQKWELDVNCPPKCGG